MNDQPIANRGSTAPLAAAAGFSSRFASPLPLSLALSLMLAACATAPKSAPVVASQAPAAGPVVPAGRLPQGVQPLSYTLELNISPHQERFSGRTQIAVQVSVSTQIVWLHGRDLHVSSVRALVGPESIPASYTQMNEDGVVALNFAKALPVGNAVIELIYDAALGRQLRGLYRVDSGNDAYAFTQFEAISARHAFPSFDEPRFKTPFDVWLTVPATDVAAANTPVLAEEVMPDGMKRVHFAPTKPLPTYLVAFAVGPFDVIDAPAIAANGVRSTTVPLRGLAVRGKGGSLAYALGEVGPTLAALERYFGSPYPYEKLDIVAVPDFGAGAMENAGLVTFREWLLLVDRAHAGEGQRRASAYVMAHELAHQWVGDLVTMPFWDDIWLNEAFATWMGNRVVGELHPEYKPELSQLAEVNDAMRNDSRVSARMIRQPIESSHDIVNAFDSITYTKGGGVLAMFERYLGAPTFQKGVQSYLAAHAYGTATTDDLLDALSAAAGKDVKVAFNTFLTQSGVPMLSAETSCEGGKAELRLRQERYLPLGSTGNKQQRWQIPVCARYESAGHLHESCTLLTEVTGSLPLEGSACPAWVMPNAEGAGYYRFTVPSAELEKLRTRAMKKLSARERLAVVQALGAGFEAGSVSGKDCLTAARTFVTDETRAVANAPMGLLRFAHDEIVDEPMRPAVEAFTRELYTPLKNRLGMHEAHGEDGETKLLRAEVLTALAETGHDAATRKRLEHAGHQYLGTGAGNTIHADAVPADVVDLALRVTLADGDAALWDAVYQRFQTTEDPVLRARLLHALASVRDARSDKALALALDPHLRVNEVLTPVADQLADIRTRDAAWQWLEQKFDAVLARLSPEGAGYMPWLAAGFCSEAMAQRVEAFFAPKIASLGGGPRSLAGTLEALRLCAARVSAQRDSVESFFDPHHVSAPPAAIPGAPPAAPAVPPAPLAPGAPVAAAAPAPVVVPAAAPVAATAAPAAPAVAPRASAAPLTAAPAPAAPARVTAAPVAPAAAAPAAAVPAPAAPAAATSASPDASR
ncbi:MAG TPA: M1 family metallopeptidase, partial [Polyangiales bacterium]